MNAQKKIIVCPLDWGIGHATRCVPVIRRLLQNNHKVLIAADNRPYAFLKEEFPDIEMIHFKGYHISYQKKGPLILKILLLIPGLLLSIIREHHHLKKIIKEHNVHAIISDNRFGLWNKNIYSIYITHQVHIKTPYKIKLLDILLYQMHKYFINQYDECWIPDYEGKDNFSGELSHRFPKPGNAFFIGPLSRFESELTKDYFKNESNKVYEYDLMLILSGPEPQRAILENLIISQLEKTNLNSLIIQGLTEHKTREQLKENILVFSHLSTDGMKQFMEKSKIILCRSGYSSIMDLSALKKEAIFIPTPGQTEQEYLAAHFESRKCFFSMKQKTFQLLSALEQSTYYNGFSLKYNPALLNDRINYLNDILEGTN